MGRRGGSRARINERSARTTRILDQLGLRGQPETGRPHESAGRVHDLPGNQLLEGQVG